MINNHKFLYKFWKGKKVFLTGHTGFKGSWFSIFLNLVGNPINDIPEEIKYLDKIIIDLKKN